MTPAHANIWCRVLPLHTGSEQPWRSFATCTGLQAVDVAAFDVCAEHPNANSGDVEAQEFAERWHMPIETTQPLQPGQMRPQWGIDGDPMARACCNAMLRAYATVEQWQRALVVLTTMVECALSRCISRDLCQHSPVSAISTRVCNAVQQR